MAARLSKSKLMAGHQCPKRLYLEVHQPELAEYSDSAQQIFDQGTFIGQEACKAFPHGINIDEYGSLDRKIKATREYLNQKNRHPLYEATFQSGDVLIKADIVTPTDKGLDIYEVKSSTSVKKYHPLDVAIQAHVIDQAGHRLNRTHLTHINNQFVYTTLGDYTGLFTHADITDEITDLGATISDLIVDAKQILDGNCPDISVDKHCHTPFDCPFLHHCQPPNDLKFPVTSLPRGGKVVDALLAEGIQEIQDIPDGRLANSVHARIRECVINNAPYLSPEAKTILQALPYPRYYLDFETIHFAMPIWLHTRPYQQLPFQFSCHIDYGDGNIMHQEFLDVTGNAPMRGFIDALTKTIGDGGCVIVYNAGFEKRILKEAADLFPDKRRSINKIIDRLVDLLPITRQHYYHRDMHGSWSLKAVSPTVMSELSYEQLESVKHGGEAQQAYLECINPNIGPARKADLTEGLRKYCALDTYAMVKIVKKLSGK